MPAATPDNPPVATVVITTKNRKDELRNAIASCLTQTVLPEVLVIDDGSTDGTSQLVTEQFPTVRLHRSEQSKGLIVQRNCGAELANGRIIFSIDDDAAFVSPRTIEQTLAEFDHPRVGAVAIPHIDVNKPPIPFPNVPRERIYALATYVGCSHAVRKDLFNRLGGYRGYLFHQGEESEYCTRLLAAGYITRLGHADPIHHYESPRRITSRIYIYRARNTLLYAWYHVPIPRMLVHMAGVVFNQSRIGVTHRHPIWVSKGLMMGFGGIVHERHLRQPLSVSTYILVRRLVRESYVPLDEIEPLLPPVTQWA